MCRTWCCKAFPDGADGVELVDARKGGALMAEITAAGLDIDQGMVLKVGAALFYGADAIREATRRSRRRGPMATLNRVLFGHARVAGALYPLLRDVRNLLLRLLGIPFIRNLEKRP
jgi:hypothetical protein